MRQPGLLWLGMTAAALGGCASDAREQAAASKQPQLHAAPTQTLVRTDADRAAAREARAERRKARPARPAPPKPETVVVVTVTWTEEEALADTRPTPPSRSPEGVFTPSLALRGLAERSAL